MRILSLKTIREYAQANPRAADSLYAWHAIAKAANWQSFVDVKTAFRSADQVADSRVIFDIAGNRYRLIAHVSYRFQTVMIKFIGTHAEYDHINPETVE